MQNNSKILSSPYKWFFSFNYNFQDINVTPFVDGSKKYYDESMTDCKKILFLLQY